MKPGPPRKPTSLKVVAGTFRKDRAARNEARPEPILPEPLPWMQPLAQEEFRRLAPQLFKNGLLTPLDVPALSAFCEAYADFITASQHCTATSDGKNKMILVSKDGQFYENPFFSVKKRAMEIMRAYANEFGLTPASR